MTKILQGSGATQTMLGGLPTCPNVAIFYSVHVQKNYETWLTVDRVIAIKTRLTF